MTTLGIIPAAGRGERWGGYMKELLPCGDSEWLLDRTVKVLAYGGADAVLIVTRPEKVAAHMAHMRGYTDVPVYYAIGGDTMWESIKASFCYPALRFWLAMPDTWFSIAPPFKIPKLPHFQTGLFTTERPERFGILHNGQIINKPTNLPAGQYRAWGVLCWSSSVVNLWLNTQPATYTDAFNEAIDHFGNQSFDLDEYHDMASIEDYWHWCGGGDTR